MNMICLSTYLDPLWFLSSAFCSFHHTSPIYVLLDLQLFCFWTIINDTEFKIRYVHVFLNTHTHIHTLTWFWYVYLSSWKTYGDTCKSMCSKLCLDSELHLSPLLLSDWVIAWWIHVFIQQTFAVRLPCMLLFVRYFWSSGVKQDNLRFRVVAGKRAVQAPQILITVSF